MPKTSTRHFLKEKEARQLLLDFSKRGAIDAERLFGAKPKIEVTQTPVAEIYLIDGKPILAKSDDTLFPTLIFDDLLSSLPKITVDMGAVPYVCNGADVMAPGVVQIEGEFERNDFLLVVDKRYGKSLAIGVALFDSRTMRATKQGKTVKNVHYVGDRLWKLLKEAEKSIDFSFSNTEHC